MYDPLRGSIWYADFSPTTGSEQRGKRPALIVSDDIFNSGPSNLIVVVPLTTKDRGISLHVRMEPDRSGLEEVSFALCDQIRTISRDRLLDRAPVGNATEDVMQRVDKMLRALLSL